VGHLLDGCGKFLKRFSDTLGTRFYVTAICGGNELVPEAEVARFGTPCSTLVARPCKAVIKWTKCGFLLTRTAVVLCYGLELAPEHDP
jgi:hypothetical protein